jgi:hypothetical protein
MVENVIKLKPYDSPDWLELLEKNVRRFDACDSVVLQWHSNYITEIIDTISRIRRIKSAPLIRYVCVVGR